ncbi:amino acid adenylation domain-containing protein [Streptomyces sp. P9-2B-2]|uniref:non-ribosomal peptide synthetase n=1 Tax=Streptomyces sp. P9-2B-2 TaxID=3057114 RepID=UPI0025B55A0B|nr:non-ribosomal peptide synthetase [Streptomyces sp. P9-2B-2]WJY36312.1 amino acid adenylation domain-containing protein [Streptomyces sp. P9-2B-2]
MSISRIEALQGPAHQQQRAAWLTAMPSPEDALHWADSVVTANTAAPGTRHRVTLGPESRRRVTAVSGGQTLGDFVVLLSALVAVVQRTSAHDVVWLSTPLLHGVDSPYGYDDRVPLVFRPERRGSFKSLLEHVRHQVATSYAVQGFPVRDLWAQADGPTDTGVVVAETSLHEDVAVDDSTELVIRINTAEGSFDVEDRHGRFPEWFADHVVGLVEKVLEYLDDTGVAVADLDLLDDDEILHQLDTLTATGVPAHTPDDSLATRFRAVAAADPDATALLTGGRAVSYGELHSRAAQFAHHLRDDLSLAEGEAVAVLVSRAEDTLVALWGCMLAGTAYVPIDPHAPTDRIAQIADAAKAKVLALHSSLLHRLTDLPTLTVCGLDLQFPAGTAAVSPAEPTWPAPRGGDAAAVITTSGSGGTPRTIVLDHAGVVNVALDHVTELGLGPSDRYLAFMALSFDGALLDIVMTHLAGAALVLPDEQELADPRRLEDLMAGHAVTATTMTPSYLSALDPLRLTDLRVLISAAEPANTADLLAYAARGVSVYNGYGPTEACVNTTLHQVDPQRDYHGVPLGRPRANMQVYILDQDRNLLPRHVIGEIAISGRGVASGYIGDPEQSARRFVPHPFRPDGGVLHLSGDLGGWDENGELVFAGRRDQQVKIRGFRVEPTEIENALRTHDRVEDAVVAADTDRGVLVAFVREPGGHGPEHGAVPVDALSDHLARTLPAYMVPSAVHLVDNFPTTEHGKVDRRALLDLHERRLAERPVSTPANPLETRLLEGWAKVLGLPAIDAEDDFFQLGGDSIRLIQAVQAAEQVGITLRTSDIIEQRTVRALAGMVAERGDATESVTPAVSASVSLTDDETRQLPARCEDAYPLTHLQERMVEWSAEPDLRALHAYHCVAGWRLRDGELDLDVLRQALRGLVERHRSLRTAIVRAAGSGRLLQCVLPPDATLVDTVEAHPEDTADTVLNAVVEADLAEAFDTDGAAPWTRFHLVVRSATEVDVVMSAHHALTDGWSGVQLRNELLDDYGTLRAGGRPDTAAPTVDSYREFVALERTLADDPQAQGFWADALATLPDGLTTPRRREFRRVGYTEVVVPPERVEALLAGTRNKGLSPKARCLSAFLAALHRHGGAPELTVGIVANGRSERLTDPLGTTGLFWNILPVNSRWDADTQPPSATAVQARLEALEPYAGYPLAGHVADDEAIAGWFNFVHFHHARQAVDRLTLVEECIALGQLHHPVVLAVSLEPATPGGAPQLVATLEHDLDRLDEASAERLMALWSEALSSPATDTPGYDAVPGIPEESRDTVQS